MASLCSVGSSIMKPNFYIFIYCQKSQFSSSFVQLKNIINDNKNVLKEILVEKILSGFSIVHLKFPLQLLLYLQGSKLQSDGLHKIPPTRAEELAKSVLATMGDLPCYGLQFVWAAFPGSGVINLTIVWVDTKTLFCSSTCWNSVHSTLERQSSPTFNSRTQHFLWENIHVVERWLYGSSLCFRFEFFLINISLYFFVGSRRL